MRILCHLQYKHLLRNPYAIVRDFCKMHTQMCGFKYPRMYKKWYICESFTQGAKLFSFFPRLTNLLWMLYAQNVRTGCVTRPCDSETDWFVKIDVVDKTVFQWK